MSTRAVTAPQGTRTEGRGPRLPSLRYLTAAPRLRPLRTGAFSLAQARRGLRFGWPPLLLGAIAIGAWQIVATTTNVGPTILPSPWRVATQGWDWREVIWSNTVPTLEETFLGFGLSLVCAFSSAILMELWPTFRRALYPFLIISQTLPLIAIAPIVDIWFGFGLLPKLLVVAIVTFFPVTVGLTEGFGSVEPEAIDLLRSMGAGRVGIFRRVKFPGAMPYFFAGLRIAITYAVVGAIFAEYVGASSGLGIFMSQQNLNLRTDLIYAAVAVTSAISIGLFAFTYLVQRLAIPWYALSRRSPAN